MLSTDLQLSLLHAKVGNLGFSNVMLSTDLQLSLLHAKVGNLGFSNVIITFTCQRMKSGILKCNYHFYMPK